MTLVELRRELEGGEPPPDAPAEIADAVSALRLTTAAAVAAGPVLFETLDGRPFGIQPVLPIAATQPPGESSRLDSFRTPIAVDVLTALGDADGDPELSDALDRWELSLFQNEPFRGEQLRAALASLLGETWAMRGCVLLGEDPACARGAVRRADLTRCRRAGDDGGRGRCATRDRRGAALSRPRSSRARPGSRAARARSEPGSARRRRLARIHRSGAKPLPLVRTGQGYRRHVDESQAILERLERIEMLDRAGAASGGARRRAPGAARGGRGVVASRGRRCRGTRVEDLRGALERDMIAM